MIRIERRCPLQLWLRAAGLAAALFLVAGTASADPNDGVCSWFEWLTPCSGDNLDCCRHNTLTSGSGSEASKAGGKAIPTDRATCTERVAADYRACVADRTQGPRTCSQGKRRAAAFCETLPARATVGRIESTPAQRTLRGTPARRSTKLAEMQRAAGRIQAPGQTPAVECCHNFGCQTTSTAESCKSVIKLYDACASSDGKVTCAGDKCHCSGSP